MKPYLIAEILLQRGLPVYVVKEITKLTDHEIDLLKHKWDMKQMERESIINNWGEQSLNTIERPQK